MVQQQGDASQVPPCSGLMQRSPAGLRFHENGQEIAMSNFRATASDHVPHLCLSINICRVPDQQGHALSGTGLSGAVESCPAILQHEALGQIFARIPSLTVLCRLL